MHETILHDFIPDLQTVKPIDTFENFEAGGEFMIYKITRKQLRGPLYVCLFDYEEMSHPFDRYITSPIEEIELGGRWQVDGCFYAHTGEVLRVNDPIAKDGQTMRDIAHTLRVVNQDNTDRKSTYYLYSLTPRMGA